jgi:hypothetical protein
MDRARQRRRWQQRPGSAQVSGLDADQHEERLADDLRASPVSTGAAPIREQICRDAAWLGVELDRVANAVNGPRISMAASRTSACVIPINEEPMIARHTRGLLAA